MAKTNTSLPTARPVLISWIAWTNDYQKEKPELPAPTGPNYSFHQHFYEEAGYDKHLLLTSCPDNGGPEAKRSQRLAGLLQDHFPDHRIELKYLDVKDVIGFQEILQKVQPLLLEHRDHQVDIFLSPGTPMMQVVWIALAQSKLVPCRLLQGIEPRHSPTKQPGVRELVIEASPEARALVVQVRPTGTPAPDEPLVLPVLEPVYRQAARVAAFSLREITTLIRGESGTGKEYLARFLHEQSSRKGKAFRAFNCAALTDSTLESRLFGYRKGAFTGADKDTKGIFAECDGGTLFLDEIGDISPYLQQFLLRVLQEGEIQPMGAVKAEPVDVKVVAATHRDLRQLCAQGTFRWDLYYRLTTTELHLPPLREYPAAEKKQLAEHLLQGRASRLEQPQVLQPGRKAWDWLRSYPFPGNIRELQQIIDRWYIFGPEDGSITADLLPTLGGSPGPATTAGSEGLPANWQLDQAIREHARQALRYFGRNRSRTAKELGISVNSLKKYLDLPEGE